MKIKYSKYTGEDFGIDAEDLLQALSDFLLQSGFNTQYMPFSEWNEHTLEDLKKAIQQALEQRRAFRQRAHARDDGAPAEPVAGADASSCSRTWCRR